MDTFLTDLPTLLFWYSILTSLGLVALPASRIFFRSFPDRGYAMAKILGFLVPAYAVWLLASLRIAPFSFATILVVLGIWAALNVKIAYSNWRTSGTENGKAISFKLILFQETLFLLAFLFWSYIRGHEPSIHGLEKFMDFGFINSILNTQYFPPPDMWLARANPGLAEGLAPDQYAGGYAINYYYFGHYIGAFLTKLSSLSSAVTYNLILSSIFAWTFVCSFSIVSALVSRIKPAVSQFMVVVSGFLGGYLVTLAGNLHTIYLLTKGYPNDTPVPFWQIWDLRPALVTGNYNYWYPNATRFIPNTIHEFPSYSWVVADLHGHVFDIPFVLLTLGVLLSIIINVKFQSSNDKTSSKSEVQRFGFWNFGFIWNLGFRIWDLLLLGFLTAVMYMTNAWDGLIYLGLTGLLIFIINVRQILSSQAGRQISNVKFLISKKIQISKFKNSLGQLEIRSIRNSVTESLKAFAIVLIFFILFNLPFSIHFKPFVHGIGIVGGYEMAEAVGLVKLLGTPTQTPDSLPIIQIGPFLLEKGNNLRSPVWMLGVLWGFFYFHVIAFLVLLTTYLKSKIKSPIRDLRFTVYGLIKQIEPTNLFILSLITISTLLLIFPEFFYAKDIYPAHYRANTMFKLGYQAFIMLSMVSAYTIVLVKRFQPASMLGKLLKTAYLIVGAFLLFLVMIYPNFAIKSYYGVGENRSYEGQDGMRWLEGSHPGDYALINWIRNEQSTMSNEQSSVLGAAIRNPESGIRNPVILEAVGESYTDYARISANSGLSTVLGWPVHEWLWRGSYDEPGRRVELVRQMYEGTDSVEVRRLLDQFNVTYVVVGEMEREKYTALNETIFGQLGTIVFSSNNTNVYKVR